jgi:hypothetical protein
VIDQEILASQIKADQFPFPCEGEISLAVRNANYALGPVSWGPVRPFQRMCTKASQKCFMSLKATSQMKVSGICPVRRFTSRRARRMDRTRPRKVANFSCSGLSALLQTTPISRISLFGDSDIIPQVFLHIHAAPPQGVRKRKTPRKRGRFYASAILGQPG